jgi:hypothetical protein
MRKIILSIVLALTLAAMCVGTAMAQEVTSKEEPVTGQVEEGLMRADTDGWVYEGEDCDGNNWRMGHTDQYRIPAWRWVTFPAGWWYDTESQTSDWYYASEGWLPPGIDNKVYYDYCEMEFRGAGWNDYNNLYLHEQAHSRGWDHWEEPAYLNPAYNEYVEITGY